MCVASRPGHVCSAQVLDTCPVCVCLCHGSIIFPHRPTPGRYAPVAVGEVHPEPTRAGYDVRCGAPPGPRGAAYPVPPRGAAGLPARRRRCTAALAYAGLMV